MLSRGPLEDGDNNGSSSQDGPFVALADTHILGKMLGLLADFT